MRILDRYVLSNFLLNYLICFFVLIGLFMVVDAFERFELDRLDIPRLVRDDRHAFGCVQGTLAPVFFGKQKVTDCQSCVEWWG